MRFKPPPPNSPIGWRVEFRPCEAQLTDFENAAYVCFVVLLTRVILSYHLNFVMPISKVISCGSLWIYAMIQNYEIVRIIVYIVLKTCRWMKTCSVHRGEMLASARSSGGAATLVHPLTLVNRPTTRQNCMLR